jgi:hypothetical protein
MGLAANLVSRYEMNPGGFGRHVLTVIQYFQSNPLAGIQFKVGWTVVWMPAVLQVR